MTDSVNSSPSTHQPAEFWLGVEQFNQGNYYACHDTLEAIWIDSKVGEQGFYQGILQIDVGLYHLGNLNWRGSAILLGEGSHRLDAYGDFHGGINVTDLVNQSIDWLTALQETGPDQIQQLASVLSGIPLDAEPYRLENGEKLIPPTIHLA